MRTWLGVKGYCTVANGMPRRMPRRDASAVWCAVAWQWRWPIDNTLDGGRRCASSCSTATRNGFGSAITPTARSRVRVLCVCASCVCAPVQQPPQCAPVQGHVLPCARGLLVFLSALVWPLSLACCLPACLPGSSLSRVAHQHFGVVVGLRNVLVHRRAWQKSRQRRRRATWSR